MAASHSYTATTRGTTKCYEVSNMADYRDISFWLEVWRSTAWLEWTKAIFDLAKGVAWPAAIVAVILVFKAELAERLKDIASAGPTGISFHPSQKQPPQADNLEGLEESTPKEASEFDEQKPHGLPSVEKLREKIRGQLAEMPEAERIPRLVYFLAEAQIERQFEQIWADIFGSQLRALRDLQMEISVKLNEAENYFKQKFPELQTISFQAWIDFLKASELIEITGDVVRLTDFGVDFLKFVDVKKPGRTRPL